MPDTLPLNRISQLAKVHGEEEQRKSTEEWKQPLLQAIAFPVQHAEMATRVIRDMHGMLDGLSDEMFSINRRLDVLEAVAGLVPNRSNDVQ